MYTSVWIYPTILTTDRETVQASDFVETVCNISVALRSCDLYHCAVIQNP